MVSDELANVDSILLVQRRYHTNQHPVVETLLERGHNVRFLALATENAEEYSALQPDMLRFSPIFLLFETLVKRFVDEMFRYRYGFPSLMWYYTYLREDDPDLIIVKDYYVVSFVTIVYAKWFGIDLVFYDQAPVYAENTSYTKRRIATIIYYALHKERFVRFSPVLGNPGAGYAVPRSYYIPFVVRTDRDVEDRSYFRDGKVNIVMVGKLHSRRKNHLLLLRVIDDLSKEYDVTLAIVGSLSDPSDPYYNEIRSFIDRHGLDDIVEIKPNLSYDTVHEEYRRHDVYVLPSKREPAAVSHLEAMSEGLPVVCSQTNGTSCYVHEGSNGFLVDSEERRDVRRKLERLLDSRDRIREFGRHSYYLAKTEHSPERFYQRVRWMLAEQ